MSCTICKRDLPTEKVHMISHRMAREIIGIQIGFPKPDDYSHRRFHLIISRLRSSSWVYGCRECNVRTDAIQELIVYKLKELPKVSK